MYSDGWLLCLSCFDHWCCYFRPRMKPVCQSLPRCWPPVRLTTSCGWSSQKTTRPVLLPDPTPKTLCSNISNNSNSLNKVFNQILCFGPCLCVSACFTSFPNLCSSQLVSNWILTSCDTGSPQEDQTLSSMIRKYTAENSYYISLHTHTEK